MGGNDNNAMMDILNILSFAIGIVNYNENISQSNLQETAERIIKNIQEHLQEQDRKIDHIIEILESEGK